MKFSLVHCYSDNNKGDAGIILATIHAIKKSDPNAEINLFSTYSSKDNKYKTDHEFLKKHCNNLYTSLFPEPFLKFGNKQYSGAYAKIISFIFLYVKWNLILLLNNSLIDLILLSKDEKKAFNKFKESDFIISKGGSFLYSEGTVRSSLSLIRMLYPFDLGRRLNKKVIILGQSLGPIVSNFDKKIFNKSLSNVSDIYIREVECINYLKKLNTPIDFSRLKTIPDLAFCLPYENTKSPIKFEDDTGFKVGFTIVDHHDFKVAAQKRVYLETMLKNIEFVVQKLNAKVYIFPQVIVPGPFGTNDLKQSIYIYEQLKPEVKLKVVVLEDSFNPFELKKMYSYMDLFIATRLHSAIFAQGAFVPSINIGYHGTKSMGTMKLLGLEKFVISIDEITPEMLQAKIVILNDEKENIKSHLKVRINEIQSDIYTEIDRIIYTKN